MLIVASIVLAALLTWAWRILNWVWLRPKRAERLLRKQGLAGSSYTLLVGDSRRSSRMAMEARSKPINLSDDISPRVMSFLFQTVKDHGKICFGWIGPVPRVVMMNPDQVKEILNKVYEFPKSQTNPLIRTNTGVSKQNGEKWAKHRKIINPAFYQDKLKNMVPAICQSCGEMINKWEKLVWDKESQCEVDVWPFLTSLTSDLISRTAFGSSYEEGRTIFELLSEQAQLSMQVLQTVYIPGWRFVPTKRNRRINEIDRKISDILRGMIGKREKAKEAGEPVNDADLLGILLESNSGQARGDGLRIEEVIEECKLFYFAGQESSSELIVWTLVLLGHHQEWQDRARDEVFRVFGQGMPHSDGLNHLKVITMILYEVLRLYPPSLLVNRTVDRETRLGDLVLPAGAIITIPIVLIHRDGESWGADVGEFKPERFSGGVSKAAKNIAAFIPFLIGSRVCVGQNFAMMEAKIAVAMILQRFKFGLSASYTHAPVHALTLRPQFGAHLVLSRI